MFFGYFFFFYFYTFIFFFFFFSSRRRHTRSLCDWSSDVCSSDLAELRGLENLLACCRDEPSPDEQQVADLEKTIKWLRRRLKLPTPRPAEPEPEPKPIIEEPPDQHVCWHEARRQWGWR